MSPPPSWRYFVNGEVPDNRAGAGQGSIACNWALSDSSMRSAPKIVQLFTIGEISSTKLQGNSLDNTFTLDCELPSTCAIRIHAETQGGQMRSTESLGDVVVIHPLDPEDGSSIIPIRTAGRTQKGVRWRIDARKQFDALMDGVSPPDDVTFESATVGDVPGLLVHPASSRSRRFCICTGGGSTREAPRHIATLSGTSP
jgi:hypothetical protein